ncbi:hypothetical protein RIR_jg18700.t1 [Rhizophagus irregularis DAOM 181602=DAOM 197198]|nr:hypothetical protein RIR_jg37586.t1 [Rhizophagus irregularis DAOM 181602=DAOM 197198]GET66692.1 hypothetical protein RIR_jg18700.t1 [Rhizophagus irregularis DAOM 181602=DAOM 197198]
MPYLRWKAWELWITWRMVSDATFTTYCSMKECRQKKNTGEETSGQDIVQLRILRIILASQKGKRYNASIFYHFKLV